LKVSKIVFCSELIIHQGAKRHITIKTRNESTFCRISWFRYESTNISMTAITGMKNVAIHAILFALSKSVNETLASEATFWNTSS
jgi:hypothetical protein